MKRFVILALAVLSGVLAATSGASAQQRTLKQQLIGTWRFGSSVDLRKGGERLNRWGANPVGIFMFTENGRYAQMIMRTEVRAFGTKTVASFGTYTVNEADKTILTHMEGSSIPKFIGAEEKRQIISLTGDELKYSNPSTTAGTSVVATWRRVR